jgi:hypothetical protein
MNKTALIVVGAVVLLAGLLWWMRGQKSGFDMDAFVQQVKRLQSAARMARKVSDAKRIPDYLQPEVDYLDELRKRLQDDSDCRTRAAALSALFESHMAEHPDLSDEALSENMAQLNSRERRNQGLRLILVLAPRWQKLVQPVKQFAKACPEESVVLNRILLGKKNED